MFAVPTGHSRTGAARDRCPGTNVGVGAPHSEAPRPGVGDLCQSSAEGRHGRLSFQGLTTKIRFMKLVIFGLTVSSSWGNGHATLWRGLCRALARRGHQIVFSKRMCRITPAIATSPSCQAANSFSIQTASRAGPCSIRTRTCGSRNGDILLPGWGCGHGTGSLSEIGITRLL